MHVLYVSSVLEIGLMVTMRHDFKKETKNPAIHAQLSYKLTVDPVKMFE